MKKLIMLMMLAFVSASYAGQFELSYSDNSDNETGFSLEVSIDGGEFVEALTVEADVENMTYETPDDTTRETLFAFRVCAFNDNGKSGYTNTVETSIKSSTSPETPNGLNIRYVDTVTINAENVIINPAE